MTGEKSCGEFCRITLVLLSLKESTTLLFGLFPFMNMLYFSFTCLLFFWGGSLAAIRFAEGGMHKAKLVNQDI